MSTCSRATFAVLVAAACVARLPAKAQSAVADAPHSSLTGAVEVRIGAVLASNSGDEFDQRLAAMHRQFDNLFRYTSYRLVKEQRQRVPWGAKVGFDIPGGRYVLVVPKEFKNERVSMKIVLIDGVRPVVDTVLSMPDGGTLLVGGPRQPDGVLILSIGADMVP